MQASQLWDIILRKAKGSEFEIHNVPQNKTLPLCFVVGAQGDQLIINNAKSKTPSVKLSNKRKISFKDFEFVHSFYHRWLKGDSGVRHEVSRKSRNTAYIFALIAEASKQRI
jgi:hypothetical protein